MRKIQNVLVVGIRVNSRHHAPFDLKIIMENFHHRRHTVGGAGCIGNEVMFFWIVLVVVDAHAYGEIRAFRRSGEDDFFDCVTHMFVAAFGIVEDSGSFQNNVDFFFAPRNFCRIFFLEVADLFSSYRNISRAVDAYVLGQRPIT